MDGLVWSLANVELGFTVVMGGVFENIFEDLREGREWTTQCEHVDGKYWEMEFLLEDITLEIMTMLGHNFGGILDESIIRLGLEG